MLAEHIINVNKQYIRLTYCDMESEYYGQYYKAAKPAIQMGNVFVSFASEDAILMVSMSYKTSQI